MLSFEKALTPRYAAIQNRFAGGPVGGWRAWVCGRLAVRPVRAFGEAISPELPCPARAATGPMTRVCRGLVSPRLKFSRDEATSCKPGGGSISNHANLWRRTVVDGPPSARSDERASWRLAGRQTLQRSAPFKRQRVFWRASPPGERGNSRKSPGEIRMTVQRRAQRRCSLASPNGVGALRSAPLRDGHRSLLGLTEIDGGSATRRAR